MNQKACPSCEQSSADGLICRKCQRDARRALIKVAQHWPDVYRRRAGASNGGAAGGHPKVFRGGVPINDRQAKTIAYVRNQLGTWARALDMGDLGDYGGDVVMIALWLATRVQRMVGHEAGVEAVDEMIYCADLIRRMIEPPIEKSGCGTCPVCNAAVVAYGDDETGTCRRCEQSGVITTLPRLAKRTDLIGRLEDEPMPRRLLMEALPLLGIHVKPATIRQWRHRKRLIPVTSEQGADLYRISDVRRLLAEDKAKIA